MTKNSETKWLAITPWPISGIVASQHRTKAEAKAAAQARILRGTGRWGLSGVEGAPLLAHGDEDEGDNAFVIETALVGDFVETVTGLTLEAALTATESWPR